MKKKPSLLDIELFVQKRADEKHKDMLQIEGVSDTPQYSKENIAVEVQPNPPVVVEEILSSIIDVTDSQRDDINKLRQDMFKLKEQLRVYHSFLTNQQKKISELEKSISEKSLSDENPNKGVTNENYSKLLLKNIVWLKEEKDFSFNDVARLFRAEGFQTPDPYDSWNEKVINSLYIEAKENFM